jgi:hypothetical protein
MAPYVYGVVRQIGGKVAETHTLSASATRPPHSARQTGVRQRQGVADPSRWQHLSPSGINLADSAWQHLSLLGAAGRTGEGRKGNFATPGDSRTTAPRRHGERLHPDLRLCYARGILCTRDRHLGSRLCPALLAPSRRAARSCATSPTGRRKGLYCATCLTCQPGSRCRWFRGPLGNGRPRLAEVGDLLPRLPGKALGQNPWLSHRTAAGPWLAALTRSVSWTSHQVGRSSA